MASKKRIFFYDFLKGFAVLIMFFIHVLLVLSQKSVLKSPFGQIIYTLSGIPAAPIFMFCMGATLSMPSSLPLLPTILRGLRFVAFGYLLNFLRASLPKILGLGTFDEAWMSFFMVDIFCFAGLAMIFITLFQNLLKKSWISFILLTAVVFLSPALAQNADSYPHLLNPIIGRHHLVYFPFFPWIVYPVLGFCFAESIRKFSLKNWIFFAIGSFLLITIGTTMSGNLIRHHSFYHPFPMQLLRYIGIVGLWLVLAQGVSIFLERYLRRPFQYLSIHVSPLYVISWLVINWSVFLIGKKTLDFSGTLIAMFLVTLVTIVINQSPVGAFISKAFKK